MDALVDQANAVPVTAVGAATAVIITPPFGATLVLCVCVAAAVQKPGATVAPQVVPVMIPDQALGLAAALVAIRAGDGGAGARLGVWIARSAGWSSLLRREEQRSLFDIRRLAEAAARG